MTPNAFRAMCMLAGVAHLCLIPAMKATAPEKVLIDFSNTDTPAWQVVNDDVMGGVSKSRFVVTNGTAVFRGKVSLANNGGFASVRSSPAKLDLTGFDAFILRVRGDGRKYKFTVRTDSSFHGPIYPCAFTTKTGTWEEHRLAFQDFVPTFRGYVLTDAPAFDPARVVSVGILIADKQAGPFRLELAWIKASSAARP